MAEQISDRHQCIFVHIPKAAGSSIERSSIFQDQREKTGEYVGGHTTALKFQENYPNEFNRYFKFTFVRNPYSRLFSAFHYLSSGGIGYVGDKIIFEKYFNNQISFQSFCMEILSEEVMKEIVHMRPQYEFICDNNMKIIVDFIGYQESFRKDSKYVFKRLNLPYEYRYSNYRRGLYRHFSLMYTSEMQKKVGKLYEADFRLLNYPYEIPLFSTSKKLIELSQERFFKTQHLVFQVCREVKKIMSR